MKQFIYFISIAIIFLLGCNTEEVNVIPNIKFSATISLNDPSYESNPFIVNRDDNGFYVGHRGVIVFKLSDTEFYAFDRMCTYEKEYSCLVNIVDGSNAECSCCESQYLIMSEFGDVIKGPAEWALKSYKTHVNGEYLSIYN